MAFERPISIMEALTEIDRNHYALPALQREFVWKPEQICTLFDSIMKGYPIGSFLFWKLEPETARDFKFYTFMRDYHERNNPYCEEFPVQTSGPEIAVLDGQQRLTSLNIGLFGSYASKKKYAPRDTPRSYPVKHLYLNLLFDPLEEAEQTLDSLDDAGDHEFKFLTEREASTRTEKACWFKVSRVRELEDSYECNEFVMDLDLERDQLKRASKLLSRLHKVIHAPMISYYLERDQHLDKVLTVFIRINSGGTKLSYADLLLSVATTQWESVDARKAINDLMETMNSYGVEQRFNFSRDFILKAGLSLTRRPSVQFTTANFTASNMKLIEEAWPGIESALHLTAQLFHDFGFNRKHLRATSSAIVVAYYLYFRGYDQRFLDRAVHAEERAEIRRWFIQIALSGIWGSGSFSDKILTRIPEFFDIHKSFAASELLELARRMGRDPYLDSDTIETMLETSYNSKDAYLILSLLLDPVQAHTARAEVDHVYPRTLMKANKLTKLGISQEDAVRMEARANTLPNLWLLSGTTNREKGKKMPLTWLEEFDETTRDYFINHHLLHDLVEEREDFDAFYEARKDRLRPLLTRAFGRPGVAAPPEDDASSPSLREPSEAVEMRSTSWSEDTLAMLEECYHPLAQVLMAAGIPEPEDVDRELVRGGLTTSERSIMNWSTPEGALLLLESTTSEEKLAATCVRLQDDFEQVASQINAIMN